MVPAIAPQPALRTLVVYAASMPDYAASSRAKATLEEMKEAALRRLHAHMATSSPLQLHALPAARAGTEQAWPVVEALVLGATPPACFPFLLPCSPA